MLTFSPIDRIAVRPPIVKSLGDAVAWLFRSLSPFSDGLGFSVNGQSTGFFHALGVALLLAISSPSAISRFVVPIVVDTVNRDTVSFGFGSHVGDEVLKHLPTVTDSDASTSVVFPISSSGVGTSIPHIRPASVFNESFSPMPGSGSTMGGVVFGGNILLITTTTGGVIGGAEGRSKNRLLIPAVALTQPQRLSIFGATLTGQDDEATNAPTRKIDEFVLDLLDASTRLGGVLSSEASSRNTYLFAATTNTQPTSRFGCRDSLKDSELSKNLAGQVDQFRHVDYLFNMVLEESQYPRAEMLKSTAGRALWGNREGVHCRQA